MTRVILLNMRKGTASGGGGSGAGRGRARRGSLADVPSLLRSQLHTTESCSHWLPNVIGWPTLVIGLDRGAPKKDGPPSQPAAARHCASKQHAPPAGRVANDVMNSKHKDSSPPPVDVGANADSNLERFDTQCQAVLPSSVNQLVLLRALVLLAGLGVVQRHPYRAPITAPTPAQCG